jgi:hypothetical protein
MLDLAALLLCTAIAGLGGYGMGDGLRNFSAPTIGAVVAVIAFLANAIPGLLRLWSA